MKKALGLLLSLVMLGGLLAACGNNTSSTTPEPSSTTPASSVETDPAVSEPTGSFEGQELNIAVFEGGYGPTYWEEIVALFEDAYGVTVNMQISPSIGEIITPQVVAGNVPDFLSMNQSEASGLVLSLIKEQGLLDITDVFDNPGLESDVPLRDLMLDGLMDSAMVAPYGDGRVYLAPFDSGPNAMVYNKTLFEEKNWDLPVTWDDFFALGDLAAAEGISLFTYPGNSAGYIKSVMFPAMANNAGLQAMDDLFSYKEGAFENPEIVEVLEKIAEISSEGYLLPGTVGMNHTQTQNEVMLNNALFIPNGVWIENEMADAPRADGFEFAMTAAPVLKPDDTRYVLSSIGQLSIPANAANPELAKEFLRFLYTEQSVKLFAEHSGGVFAMKGAVELVKDYVSEGVYNMYQVYDMGNFIIDGWKALPADAKVSPNGQLYDQLADVMNGTMTAEQWAAHMEDVYAEIRAAE